MPRSTSRVLSMGHERAAIASSTQQHGPMPGKTHTDVRQLRNLLSTRVRRRLSQPAVALPCCSRRGAGTPLLSHNTRCHKMGRRGGPEKGHLRYPSMSPFTVATQRDHGSQTSPLGFVSNYPSCMQSRQFPHLPLAAQPLLGQGGCLSPSRTNA